jgi:DNA-binding transcriptional ArsR family regulator
MSIACEYTPLAEAEKIRLESIFKGMSNRTRINIIDLLRSEGPLRPTDIALTLGEPQANISHHLREMKDSGHLVVEQPIGGRERFYSISPRMTETIDRALSL